MLVTVLAAFTVRSMIAFETDSNLVRPIKTGNGGKPLLATDPARNFVEKTVHDDVTQTGKRGFECVSLASALNFFASSVLVISQVLAKQSEHWWRGQSAVVCCAVDNKVLKTLRLIYDASDLLRRLFLRLQPVPYLTPRFDAFADHLLSLNVGRKSGSRDHSRSLLARFLHPHPVPIDGWPP